MRVLKPPHIYCYLLSRMGKVLPNKWHGLVDKVFQNLPSLGKKTDLEPQVQTGGMTQMVGFTHLPLSCTQKSTMTTPTPPPTYTHTRAALALTGPMLSPDTSPSKTTRRLPPLPLQPSNPFEALWASKSQFVSLIHRSILHCHLLFSLDNIVWAFLPMEDTDLIFYASRYNLT